MPLLLYCLLWNLLLVTVLALLLWVVGLLPVLQNRPALRQILWLLVLLKLVTPPLMTVPILPETRGMEWSAPEQENVATELYGSLFIHDDRVAHDLATSGNIIEDNTQTRLLWNSAVLFSVFSCLGTLILWIKLIAKHFRMRNLLTRFQAGSQRAEQVLQQLCAHFHLTQKPALVVIDAACSPMLWSGTRRKIIILPRTFSEVASEEQLRHVLAHELAHLVRRDHLVSLVAFLITSLFWWNPVAWFARREMLMAMESCCDALAIERSASTRQSYAKTLLSVVDTLSHSESVLTVAGAQFGEFQSFKRRIEMIARSRVKFTLSPAACLLTVSCGLMVMTLLPISAGAEPKQLKDETVPQTKVSENSDQGAQAAETQEKPKPGTATYHKPGISHAQLVSWGVETSLRGYFFDTEEAAESFAKTIEAFRIARRFQLEISEYSLFDNDNHKILMPSNHAEQLQIDSNKVILLQGDRKQHQRIEQIMKALGAE
ncbi:Regulatory protein BlaR1 [Gimesia panareensis]|uniref:Regulatory protein BlaR1 n=1 Tax=Gimesia panareensis TaxID=2527978 RepID=A0A518FS54_9PLAN|nr:M56 family metallopeptidase [Gimesia panareensis]QDV19164.1 Regulatory protein BlaR1 [Gimesia panareensis]